MSYIEKTARKLYPILTELKRRMIPEKRRPKTRSDSIVAAIEDDSDELVIDLAAEQQIKAGVTKNQALDMKNILGYLNQGEWTSRLSIGSIM